MHRLPALLCLPLCLLLSPAALAWSALGHRLVGELAQRQLEPAAREQVRRLLAGEPEPTLAGVATWADELRGTDLGRKTAPWHYVNFRGGDCTYVPERDCPNGDCVVGAIERQRAILADRRRPRAERREALKFLVHFVADVHQPLHASPRDDKGGNDFQVSLRTPLEPEAYARDRYQDGVMGTNLHAVWDYYVLAARGLDLPAYVRRLGARPWPAAPAASPPAAWAQESCRLIEARDLYPRRHRMDHRYLDRMRPLAEQRVQQAAWRLAALLNATLRP
ncbi:S1/P1 nuclease [Vulcaniibacterium gelatinicum]|uniref:S1/P1 nuclease n=1 Tax=Vulcaniibacterium gelatinicum TaxID=2598725 RepID=UPI0015F2B1A8|nr:S1/P1 nuclease [Vulcaniibacterium gelatinicum]